ADVSRRVPGPVAVLLLEAGGWRGESRGADGAGRSRRYRGRGSACLPRVSVDRRGADRRTAAGHHQRSHALLRAARDAATREGAEVRSEERRVGKECRSRWWRSRVKKKESGSTRARG